jgi:hypothetical protein
LGKDNFRKERNRIVEKKNGCWVLASGGWLLASGNCQVAESGFLGLENLQK